MSALYPTVSSIIWYIQGHAAHTPFTHSLDCIVIDVDWNPLLSFEHEFESKRLFLLTLLCVSIDKLRILSNLLITQFSNRPRTASPLLHQLADNGDSSSTSKTCSIESSFSK